MNVMEKYSLKENLVVVTGGAGLLGTKHTEALLEAGAEVVIFDVNDAALEKSKKYFFEKYQVDVVCMNVDITKEAMVLEAKKKVFQIFNKYPDVLINNAAIDPKFEKKSIVNKSRLENFDLHQWNLEISVGLTGAMVCSKIFGIEMANNKKGVILNIASDLGVIAPDQRIYKQDELDDKSQNVKPVTYSVIKHGLIGLTKYIATYWAENGVRCNAFAPGGVFNNHSEDFLNKLTPLIPMGRMAEIDEYKASIVFLCSDASSYMNGATLNMDGGRSVW